MSLSFCDDVGEVVFLGIKLLGVEMPNKCNELLYYILYYNIIYNIIIINKGYMS